MGTFRLAAGAADDTDASVGVVAYDRLNQPVSEMITKVHVDTVYPDVTFTPDRGRPIGGVTTITVTPHSADLASVSLRNSKDQEVSRARKYGKKLTVRVRAYDRAGNVRYTSSRTWHR